MPLSNLYETIVIERNVSTGFDNATWTTVSTSTDVGFIQPVSGAGEFKAGKNGEKVTSRMYTPMDNTLISYGDRVTQDSQKYLVVWPLQPSGISGKDHHKEILLGVFE